MLNKTNGIVLRSIKYGDSSLITNIFTAQYGVQTYMIQGVRSSKVKQNRAGSFQPGMLLELVVYQQQQKNMQRIKEFQPAYIYSTMQESVVKNCIVLFSVELLLRVLPEHAPLTSLFDFATDYFITLDKTPAEQAGNFPLFFIIHCSQALGYELKGSYGTDTPYLDLREGGFTPNPPAATHGITEDDSRALTQMLLVNDYGTLQEVALNAAMRMRLIEWYVAFLNEHTQYSGHLKSLAVLRTILH